MSTLEILEKILKDLENASKTEAVIGSSDGLLIAGKMPADTTIEAVVAISGTMFGAAIYTATALKIGIPNKVIVESDDYNLIIVGAGPKAFIAVKASKQIVLGLVLLEMNKAALKVKESLE
jgi:hypothetical protein